MNAQQLKNAILQETIEGRLVPQDPNDDPASVLLNRIREEKKRLVKDGKLKKKDLEVKPISDNEIPFDIPDSWEWVRLGEVSSLIGGFAFKSHEYTPTGSRVIRISDISEDGFINKTIVRYPYNEKLQQYRIYKGDILMAMTGGTVGKSLYVKVLPEESMLLNQRVAIIRVNSLVIDYIDYVVKSQHIQSIITDLKNSTNDNISMVDIHNFPIPIPPLAEQKRIVAKIEELLPKVEEYGKAQEELDKLNEELPERLKKSVLQEAISGKLVPQDPNDEPASVLLNRIREEKKRLVKAGKLKKKDLEETPISEDEIPFDIPDSWEWVRLADVFEHSSGKQLRASDTEGTLHEYITTSNLYWGRFELNKLKSMYYKDSEIEKCTAKKGDLLVCEGGDIGRSAIWSYDYDICLQNHVHRLRPYDSRYTIFVFYIMWYYKSVGLIGGKGIGIQGLSASALKTIIIPLPSLAEQKRIVAKIEELLNGIEKLKA